MESKLILSKREVDIIQELLKAKCRKQIADTLNLSIHTVDTHIRHIHIKTNTHSQSELIIWAIKNGINL
ncbi:MAG: LuxR C-terminal-related transcriptional regulator [Bacteroidetes bacterium]|nr:LuxR C-terminal-related transcriptional regulator [Bacteroidota bacterium]